MKHGPWDNPLHFGEQSRYRKLESPFGQYSIPVSGIVHGVHNEPTACSHIMRHFHEPESVFQKQERVQACKAPTRVLVWLCLSKGELLTSITSLLNHNDEAPGEQRQCV